MAVNGRCWGVRRGFSCDVGGSYPANLPACGRRCRVRPDALYTCPYVRVVWGLCRWSACVQSPVWPGFAAPVRPTGDYLPFYGDDYNSRRWWPKKKKVEPLPAFLGTLNEYDVFSFSTARDAHQPASFSAWSGQIRKPGIPGQVLSPGMGAPDWLAGWHGSVLQASQTATQVV